MTLDADFFEQRLYPFQDAVLTLMRGLETGFYLSGGTAASRVYLHHRFSEDLDFFVNDNDRFELWAGRAVQACADRWELQVLLREARFVRAVVKANDIALRLEWINDVPAHVGQISEDSVLGRVDSAENILANKITALLDRREPKDLADVWAFCRRMQLPLASALHNARSKAAGTFAPDLARVLCSATRDDWRLVRWTRPPDCDAYLDDLRELGEGIALIR